MPDPDDLPISIDDDPPATPTDPIATAFDDLDDLPIWIDDNIEMPAPASRRIPKPAAIAGHWRDDHRLAGRLIGTEICWRCGHAYRTLDRAHIIAHHAGGPDTVDNLHLLCRPCHRHTEHLHGGHHYWAELTAPNQIAGLTRSLAAHNDGP